LEVARPALGPDDRVIPATEAARLLDITPSAMRARCVASDPSVRGLAPRSEHNPAAYWLVSVDDVQAILRGKGRPMPAAPAPAVSAVATRGPAEPAPAWENLGDVQAQLLQGALSEEKDRRIAQLEALLAEQRADFDRRLAASEAQLAQVQRQLAIMTRANAEAFAVPGV
jgi:hypothetical protein